MKKTNSCRIGRRVPRFELQVHDIMLVNFLKSFIGSQHAISSEIHFKFSEAQPWAKKLHARRFEYSLKWA
jgi:hypothetical protein